MRRLHSQPPIFWNYTSIDLQRILDRDAQTSTTHCSQCMGGSMNKPIILGISAAITLTAACLWLLQDTKIDFPAEQPAAALAPTAEAPELPAKNPTRDLAAQHPSIQDVARAAMVDVADSDDASEEPARMFKADAAGNLILGEQTRVNVEKVLWLYTREEQQQKLAAVEQALPPTAYRQLTDLMDRYTNLISAAKQTYPPDTAPITVEDAITQHEGLSALRKAHLGTNAAEAMFGREERMNRQLLDFMSLEKHEGLTMEEKAMKAQEMLSKSPELAAAYGKN
jgi:hypothetical protein